MTTNVYTARDLITDAFRKIGVVGEGDPMNADQASAGARSLDRMMKSWQSRGVGLWTVAEMTVPLTTAATYTLTPRPVDVLSVRMRRSGTDIQMQRLSREEYDTLPRKTSAGVPTTWYFNRQRETATITVWPVLSVAAGEALVLTYNREFADVDDINAAVDVPGEWWDAVVFNLADRLSVDYGRALPALTARAVEELRLAMSFDHQPSIYFIGDYYR